MDRLYATGRVPPCIYDNSIVDATKVDCLCVDNIKRAFRIGEEVMP
jgi:hypothetical protein